MKVMQWLRARRRQREAEARAIDQMRRADEQSAPVEPKEVKLSQLRD
jgi:hypothetical protein